MGNSVGGGKEEDGTDGEPNYEGAHTNGQGSGHENGGKLAELEGRSPE